MVYFVADTVDYVASVYGVHTGVFCDWAVGLEFPAGQLVESDYWQEQVQTISEDVSVRNVLMHSAH